MQALRCLEELLVSSPGAQLALMEASLPLREGGALPALQVRAWAATHASALACLAAPALQLRCRSRA